MTAASKIQIVAGAVLIALLGTAGVVVMLPSERQPKVVVAPITDQPSQPKLSTMTIEEATAELRLTYALAEGEVVRLIKPPFSEARAAFVEATWPGARGSDRVRSMAIRWTGSEITDGGMSYSPMPLDYLVEQTLGIPWYSVEGINRVPWEPVHGDFAVRHTASPEQKLNALAELIRQLTDKRVRVVRQVRTRPSIVLRGDTRPGLPDARGWEVLVLTQETVDERQLSQWRSGALPRGMESCWSMQEAAKVLGVPFFVEGKPNGVVLHKVSRYQFAADAKLDPSDPQYESNLQKLIGNIQKQIGGEWRIERREIETFVLEPLP